MFKKPPFLIMLLIIASLVSGCSQKSIKIGLVLDLSGRTSEMGVSARNASYLAAEEINKNGGIKGKLVELIIKDDQGIPENAPIVDKELIDEGIILCVGHTVSGTGVMGLPVFEEAKKLLISPTMSTESLTGKDDMFMRIIGSNKQQSEMLSRAALGNKHEGVAVIYEKNNSAYSKEVCENFIEEYKRSGGIILHEDYFTSSNTTNFDEIAQRIVASGADGSLIVSSGLDLAILSQKIKQISRSMIIYSTLWGMSNDVIEKGGKAIEGAYFVGIYDKQNQNPAFLSFKEKYTKTYYSEPNSPAAYYYETLMMVAEVLKKVKTFSTEEIKNKIIEIKDFKGLQDNFNIDAFGDTQRGYQLFRVENAAFVRVKE